MRPGSIVLIFAICGAGFSQSTRTEQIEQERRAKAAELEPDKDSIADRIFAEVVHGDGLNNIGGVAGLSVRIGGLVSGSGFAFGPQYRRDTIANGNILFRATAQISLKNYQRHELELGLPKLAKDHAALDFLATRRSYPRLNYYGPGPDSKKTGRTDFLYEDVTFDGKAVVKPFRHFIAGATGGYMLINVGPGRDDDVASTDQTYPPPAAPGINRQTNYVRGGPMVSYDYRDHPGNPHSGGYYWADYLYYSDQGPGLFSFRRLNAEVQQYIPFFNSTHVLAVRGKTELSYTDPGQVVPFYMQPVLGGLDDLRGFRPFRFYDDNMIVLNAEYRQQIFSGVDMVIFADRGKVFHEHRNFNLHDLESSYGFGFRFGSPDTISARIETGFSREGFEIFLKFGSPW